MISFSIPFVSCIVLTLSLLPSACERATAEQVPVRHTEGVSLGFLVLRTEEGTPIAYGDLQQVAKKDHVMEDMKFYFKDGSFYEEITKFTQDGKFRLLSDQVIQRGPSFKQPMESWVDATTGTVTVRTSEKGKEKVHLHPKPKKVTKKPDSRVNYNPPADEGSRIYQNKVTFGNPQYSNLYDILANNCERLRLYKEAVAFAREALLLKPRDWTAMSILGVNLLRIGEEEEGKAALDKAYEGDQFNVMTVNTLKLLDSFEHFVRFDTTHFKVKLHEKEVAVLRPYVRELLEKAYDTLTEKYDFKPEGPITFEMYPDHADFEVRTLGLPGIGGILGVCFGKLFVMDSPTARKPDSFNWGSTLWHEFMHVISLQMTDHKIPRWFSEGLSVYEERKGFTGWGDKMKLDYLAAMKGKKFLPTAELNNGFTRPKYENQILVSYYQSSLVCDYIDQKFGFPALKKMLLLYKQGRSTADVFKESLGLSLEQFDEEFFKWVDDKVKNLDVKPFTELISSGQEALAKGDTDKAIEILEQAIDLYPEYTDEHNAYELLADAYLKKADKKAAIDILKKFAMYSETGYKSMVKLADLLQEQGDAAGARRALEAGIFIRPMDLEEHRKLGDLLLTLKQYGPAVREFETLLALNTPDKATAYYKLAESSFGQGNRQAARTNVMKALEIAPSYEPAQELLLKIVR